MQTHISMQTNISPIFSIRFSAKLSTFRLFKLDSSCQIANGNVHIIAQMYSLNAKNGLAWMVEIDQPRWNRWIDMGGRDGLTRMSDGLILIVEMSNGLTCMAEMD